MYLALVAAGAVCLAVLSYFLVPREVATVWRNYRILLVEDRVGERKVLDRLRTAGIKDVLSESTEPVQISDYSAVTVVSLEAARQRLIEGDPRNDGYLEGLARWFRADVGGVAYRIYYLGATGSAGLQSRIGRSLEGLEGAWLLPEGRAGLPAAFPVVGFCGLVGAVVLLSLSFRKRREGILSVAVSLPWLVLAGAGARSAAMAAVWLAAMTFAACRALAAFDEYRLSGKRREALRVLAREELPAIPLMLPALGTLALEPAFAPALGSAFVSSILVFAILGLAYRARGNERRPFRAVRIGQGFDRKDLRRAVRDRMAKLPYLVAALVILVGLGAGLAERSLSSAEDRGKQEPLSSIRLPQPRFADGRTTGNKPAPAEALGLRASAEDELVNVADWLVHRWYQEALFYLPLKDRSLAPFSSVTIPLPGRRDEVSATFDEGWAREAYRTRPREGIESLLLGEEGFARCYYAPLSGAGGRPLAPMEVLLYIILLAPPSVGAFSLAKSGLRDRREHSKAQ